MDEEPRQWNLEPETEYRFELDPGTSLAIKLVRGHAEIFGDELLEGKPYLFGYECRAAVFTWQGCTIEHVTGHPSTEYISEETAHMTAYANVHLALEQMRVRALAALHGSPLSDDGGSASSDPPRVLVLGPENSGKTTLCKILTNYCVRAGQGWTPVFVNTDTSEGAFSVPGTVSAAAIRAPLPTASPAAPLGASATSAPMHRAAHALLPLVYWYGHASTRRNPLLLDRIIRNLGENINDRWDVDPDGRVAGVIVDTPSAFATGKSGPGAKGDHSQMLIRACVDAFRINTIFVVGHEKLKVEMEKIYGARPGMAVVKIPRSGGVVELDSAYRERVTSAQLHAYMYGQTVAPPPGLRGAEAAVQGGEPREADFGLSPSSAVVAFDELKIYRIGEETMAPSSALPIGAARVVSELQPIPVDPGRPGSGVRNAVLAVLAPSNPDEGERYDEELLDLPVVGFVVVTSLDMPNKKLTVLSPSTGSLAGKNAVIGSFEWTEQVM